MWGLARELGMREKAEWANSIGDGDDDDAFASEPVAQYKGIDAEPLM